MIYEPYSKALKEADSTWKSGMTPVEKQEHFKKCADATDQFKSALEEEYGTKGKVKADLLWNKAWELGHSSGMHDVESYYSDLAELIT